jgi:hypothetical protein
MKIMEVGMKTEEFGNEPPKTSIPISFHGQEHRLTWEVNLKDFVLNFYLTFPRDGFMVKDFCITLKKGDLVVYRAISNKEGVASMSLLTYRDAQESGATSIHLSDIPAEVQSEK